jgi:uncharacterized membrane protein YqjE
LAQQQINPESQFHQRQLEQEKRKNLRETAITVVLCAIISFYGIISLICWPFWPQYYSWLDVLISVACALAGPAALPVFITLRRDRKKPVTQQEVEKRRQSSRRRLMQQAQGSIPWTFNWKGRFLQLGFAVLLLLLTFPIALMSFPLSWRSAFTLPIALGVLYLSWTFFYYALYLSPKMAKALPEFSAQELARRLSRGESTSGLDETQ